jgi:GntR family transcriptional regulator
MQRGAQLQSENALVKRFAVSRTTVRKGLEALADKGLIATRVGIGSFVSFEGEIIDSALGWTRALANSGESIETQVLRIAVVRDGKLASVLKLRNDRFLAVDRVRLLKRTGRVVSIERSRIPFALSLAGVPRDGLLDGSLNATLRQAGLFGAGGEEWADVLHLSKGDAAIAGVRPGAAFMRTRRLVRDEAGNPIEYVTSLLDPEYFSLHLKF